MQHSEELEKMRGKHEKAIETGKKEAHSRTGCTKAAEFQMGRKDGERARSTQSGDGSIPETTGSIACLLDCVQREIYLITFYFPQSEGTSG